MRNQNNQYDITSPEVEKLKEAIRTGEFNRETVNKLANNASVITSTQRTKELLTRWAIVGIASTALSILIRKHFG